MVAPLLALATLTSSPKVENYFPLTEGLTLTYENRVAKETWTSVDVVGAPVKVGERMATPIITRVSGREVDRAYFVIEDETVLLVAFSAERPLATPYPMLKVGSSRVNWDFAGNTVMQGEETEQMSKGWSRPSRPRTLDKKRFNTVEMSIEDVVGAASGVPVVTRYTGIYGEGIGLVEMTSVETIGRQRTERTRRLVSMRQAEKR
ncbi:MAG: hypothetical protein MUC92_06465 [Fimbriimonadaceae bacterium]|jgi:hypothetical protein|nr:hypothetical protein [Fimbriimonadaceae bacterium]